MQAEERRSISHFYQAYVGEIVGISAQVSAEWMPPCGSWLVEIVGFLAAFDEPLEPFLLRWRECFRPVARANYSLLLAELIMLHWSEQRVFPTTCLSEAKVLTALPENEEFFVEQLRPVRVAEYLASTSDDIQSLPPRERQQIELAFDWMASLA